MVWFSCSLEVALPLSRNGIAGQMGGWTCLSLQHGHHWGPDDYPQKVHATGKSDEKTTDWYLLKQVLGNKSLQRKRNADMTHHGWTHIQRVVSMSPMRNYVPVLLAALLGPDAFGVPFVLELQSLRNSMENDPLPWSQVWLSSSIPPPPLPTYSQPGGQWLMLIIQ